MRLSGIVLHLTSRPAWRSCALVLMSGWVSGCARPSPPSEPDAAVRDAAGDASASTGDAELGGIAGAGAIAQELPPELVAELREQGSDADGRLLILAPGFIATAACSDCGAPSYLWFLAVRCADMHRCEVLTESCEGEVRREADRFEVELRPVPGGDPEVCAGFSGSFELP